MLALQPSVQSPAAWWRNAGECLLQLRLTRQLIGRVLHPRTAAEIAADVTPADYGVPSHDRDGVLRLLRYAVNTSPGITDLTTGMANLKLVLAQLPNKSAVVQLPGEDIYLPSGITFAPTPYRQQIWLRGEGRNVTRLYYSGADAAIKFTTQTIMQRVSGLAIHLGGDVGRGIPAADVAANGIVWSPWRSLIEDVFFAPPPPVNPATASTGVALLFDAAAGLFDVKCNNLYISNWGTGIKAHGTDYSATAVTNFIVSESYVSSCNINFDLKHCLDVKIVSSQSELAVTHGLKLESIRRMSWDMGAIEGSGGYGVSFSGVDFAGLEFNCGMFNNASGNFSNDAVGYLGLALANAVAVGMYNAAYFEFYNGGLFTKWMSGSGNPVGAVQARRGSLYVRTDAEFAVIYAKGTGNDTSTAGWERMAAMPEDVSAANLGAAANAINTTGKYIGKKVWDTTNNRELRALGAGASDGWRVVDGSATVTPA